MRVSPGSLRLQRPIKIDGLAFSLFHWSKVLFSAGFALAKTSSSLTQPSVSNSLNKYPCTVSSTAVEVFRGRQRQKV